MAKEERYSRAFWISLLLRIAMVVLFGGKVFEKWIDGPGNFVAGVQQMFGPSGFPHWIVTTWAWAIVFIETLLAVWFIAGWRLKAAWMVTGLFIITLGFGLTVVGAHNNAMIDLLLVFYAVVGLRVAHADRLHA